MNVNDFAPSYVFTGRDEDGDMMSWCQHIWDGDTIRCHLALPCWVMGYQWLRIKNLYAPELREEGGPEARDYMMELVLNHPVWVKTYKRPSDYEQKKSFVRLIADVWINPDEEGNLTNIADLMVQAGYAERRT